MPLFDWNTSSSSSVLSDKFWVYWAVTIPVTILVIVIWRFWYVFDEWRWSHGKKGTVYKDFRDWMKSGSMEADKKMNPESGKTP
jgi:hypothetical protein